MGVFSHILLMLLPAAFFSAVASAQVRFTETGGGANLVSLQAPASVPSDITFILPAADGQLNQCLATDGAANLSWRSTARTNYSLDASDGSPTDALYVDAAGNVGIGTTAPTAQLDLTGSVAQSGDITPPQITANQNDYSPTGLAGANVLRLDSDSRRTITGLTGGADGRAIDIVNIGSKNIVLANENASSTAANRFGIGSNLTFGTGQGVRLVYDGTSARWRVTGTSALGTGTDPWITSGSDIYTMGSVALGSSTPPVSTLTLTTLPNAGGMSCMAGIDPGANYAAPYFGSTTASGFFPDAVYSFWYQGHVGVANPASETLTFNIGSVELVRVTSAGNVGVGTNNPSQKLHILGNLRVQGSTNCILGGGSGATNCSSDARLKENVQPIGNSLAKILALRGVEYDWNEKSQNPGGHAVGVIAQEVEKQFPTAVVQDSDSGYKKVDYAVLVAPVIQALKEIAAKAAGLSVSAAARADSIASLKASYDAKSDQLAEKDRKIKALEVQVSEMNSQLDGIERRIKIERK